MAAVATALALHWLAQSLLRNHLIQESAAFLRPLVHGDTPYRWPLQTRAALVGGRVFGDCDASLDTSGLLLRGGSRLCEIGLPLSAPVDLRRFGRLAIGSETPVPAFGLLVREQLDRPQHVTLLDGFAPAPGTEPALAALAWHYDSGGRAAPPQRAAMLRLRLADLKQDLRLHSVALLPTLPAGWPRPPWRWQETVANRALALTEAPLYAVDARSSPEALLQLREQLRTREPAAQVVFRSDVGAVAAATSAAAPAAASLPVLALPALAAAMLLSLRFPRRMRVLRGLIQTMLALSVPLALIVGLQIGDDIPPSTQAAIAMALCYALLLVRSETATPWRWSGGLHAWALAGAVPLLTAALVLAFGSVDDIRPAWTELGFYLLWALLQQYLICAVLADRLRLAGLALRWVVLCSAAMFALLHTPNAGLMLATFGGGLIWTALWLTERSLLPLALSHVAAAVLLNGMPPELLRSAEVSLRYYL